MSAPPMQQRVVIVGAGPVGLGIAALLTSGAAARHLEVVVLDERPVQAWDSGSYGLRVYALSRASQRLFERLDLWSRIAAARASPYRRMRIWEGEPGMAALNFDAAEIGEPDLGHIVEDSLLRHVLLDSLHDRPSFHHRFGIELEHLDQHAAGGVGLQFADGERLTTDLLVAADGGASRVRNLLGMPIATHDYGQHALVAHVSSEYSGETAMQRFLPTGPLALLPLVRGLSSIVWSVPNARSAELVNVPEGDFIAELEVASGHVLGRLELLSERGRFPLRLQHALRYTAPGVALAGDAAHCVHPLAGQGMNLGLLDAVCLADQVEQALARGDRVGDAIVLRRYERERKGHNVAMMVAFDALERVFRWPQTCVPLRRLGLAALDRSSATKRLLMVEALGLKRGLATRAA